MHIVQNSGQPATHGRLDSETDSGEDVRVGAGAQG